MANTQRVIGFISITLFLLMNEILQVLGNSRVRRIIFGELATEGKHPWMVQLMSGRSHHCGATLINRCYVLTAAHCLQLPGVANRLAIGDYDVWTTTGKEIFFANGNTVDSKWKLLVHPGASTWSVDAADIGLIKLPKCVDYVRDQIEPIALADAKAKTGCPTTSYGWGEDETFKSQRRLRISKQTPVYKNKCLSKKKGGWCHIYVRPDKEYNGDSGGPLIGNGANGEDCQLGTVESTIWGVDSRYMDVSHFIPWIKQVIKDDPCPCGDSAITTCNAKICNCGPDVIFAIDKSRKLDSSDIETIKTLMKNIVTSLNGLTDDGAKFGAVIFDKSVTNGFFLDKYTAENVEDGIDKLELENGSRKSNLAKALNKISKLYFMKNGDRKNHANIVFVITKQTKFQGNTDEIARLLERKRKASVFVLYIGNRKKRDKINAVATDPDNIHAITIDEARITDETLIDGIAAKLKNVGCPPPHDDD